MIRKETSNTTMCLGKDEYDLFMRFFEDGGYDVSNRKLVSTEYGIAAQHKIFSSSGTEKGEIFFFPAEGKGLFRKVNFELEDSLFWMEDVIDLRYN